ncbi:hypothetical protein QTG54_004656 [Skeletonema marinoi]|uniref:Gamma-glutamylcyclotransferase n=1 Tax=Skeletonema marinoi TaxID=267567 RepID=A0AAD8YE38_9STRA|nr:hypothetical protein QTG54_004656 [Skeletonema marinoi]
MKVNIIASLLSSVAVVTGFSSHTLPIGLNRNTTPISRMATADADEAGDDHITILGFGSLLSEKSSRTTFPTLKNFRLGRVLDHRRTFAHPASIFFQRNIANLETLEISSLSVEYKEGCSMVCSVFEVPNEGLSAADAPGDTFIPSQKFLEREEEFEITRVRYEELATSSTSGKQEIKEGVICRRSTDEAYIARWGQERFQKNYLDYVIKTIWGWTEGIRPCPVYLRHCILAAWSCDSEEKWSKDGVGGICYNSFLDETVMVDRATSIREYIDQYPEVMNTEPPDNLKERYSG